MPNDANELLSATARLNAKGVASDVILGALIARLERRLPGLREEVRMDVRAILGAATAEQPDHPITKEALRAAEILMSASST